MKTGVLLRKVGGSLTATINKDIVNFLSLREGDFVVIDINKQDKVLSHFKCPVCDFIFLGNNNQLIYECERCGHRNKHNDVIRLSD